jgi:F-type H+-transporting ATPase subunit delta
MSDVIAAGRYTRALFELAEKESHLAEIDATLHALAKVLKTQPKLLLLMANPTLTNREKFSLAASAIPEKKSGLLERFLRVLIDKKRFALLPDIQKIFHDHFEKKQGVQEVEMLSAVPLSAGFMEKLKVILTKKIRTSPLEKSPAARTEIRLIPRTDRTLLGGFILRFNGKEIDCSFKNRLYEIQQKLFSFAEEGIA